MEIQRHSPRNHLEGIMHRDERLLQTKSSPTPPYRPNVSAQTRKQPHTPKTRPGLITTPRYFNTRTQATVVPFILMTGGLLAAICHFI